MSAASSARRLAREPLLHFALLGAVLFGIYRLLNPAGTSSEAGGEIVVTAGRIRSLADGFARSRQRAPTPVEIEGLVEEHIREEVFYREALALGLDRDDTVVRRRLRQKLEFAHEDLTVAEPSAAELTRFLADNPAAYRREAQLSFTQVFLDPLKRGDRLETDAATLLALLRRQAGNADAGDLGDRLMVERRHEQVTATDIARLFGPGFADALRELPVGTWVGPVRSGYGAHLVRIESRMPGRQPSLDEVRDAVTRDWRAARARQMLDDYYQSLRQRYQIRVEAVPEPAGEARP